MPEYPISLDESSQSEYGPAIANKPHKHYPCLNLHWKESYDLPEDGTMVVRFHKKRETNTESDDGDSQSVELEILSIESVKADKDGAPKKSSREEAEEALDSYKDDVDDGAYV